MTTREIDAVMQRFVDERQIAGGALLVRQHGEPVYQNKWGWADLAAEKPIEYDSIYRMMSMTKPVTAVAVLQLAEQGKIGLDEPISRILPEFREMRVVRRVEVFASAGRKSAYRVTSVTSSNVSPSKGKFCMNASTCGLGCIVF